MTSSMRQDVEAIYRASIAAVRADYAVRANVHVFEDGTLVVAGNRIEIGPEGVFSIAIGKAAVAMTDSAAHAIGERFVAGIAITKAEGASEDPRVTVLRGSHPVPDERSLVAGDAVLRFVASIPAGAVVLCLISGGGSALVESLHDGVSLERLRELTSGLLKAGASIHELNAVRSRLSRIKAGGLLGELQHVRVINLIVSDVLGDDLETIASGPTVPAHATDADEVMRRFWMTGGLPTMRSRPQLELPPTSVIANLSLAIDTAERTARERGYSPVVLTRSMTGEARETGSLMAAIVADSSAGHSSFGARTCLIAGGETTVTVRGDGLGGRNSEAALAAAIKLSGVADVALGFLATDGDDGATGAAGAIIDGSTVRAEATNDALSALEANDSFPFLRDRGAALNRLERTRAAVAFR